MSLERIIQVGSICGVITGSIAVGAAVVHGVAGAAEVLEQTEKVPALEQAVIELRHQHALDQQRTQALESALREIRERQQTDTQAILDAIRERE